MEPFNPYHPPSSPVGGQPIVLVRPGVWKWFVAYCIGMALLYFGCMLFGGIVAFAPGILELEEDQTFGLILFTAGLALTIHFGMASYLYPSPWV